MSDSPESAAAAGPLIYLFTYHHSSGDWGLQQQDLGFMFFYFFLHIFPAQTPLNSPIPLPSLPLFTEPGRMLNSPEAKTYLRTAGCDLFI